MVHLSMADRRMSGFYARAEYKWMPDGTGTFARQYMAAVGREAEAGASDPGDPAMDKTTHLVVTEPHIP